jgi:hypothetical protein
MAVEEGRDVKAGTGVVTTSISVEEIEKYWGRIKPRLTSMINKITHRQIPTARAIPPTMNQDLFDCMKTSTDVGEILSWEKPREPS